LELYDSGKTKEEIVKTTGATNASVSNYIQSYEESKASPEKPSFYYAKKLKVDEFSKFYHVLRQESKKPFPNSEIKEIDTSVVPDGCEELLLSPI